ncbi:5-formyltetrahydrofolate cyclo-ligase [Alsobacter soli]|uniref:5-formyltetrahydrofolate cyclo-ligase n=1 Tax=Alsobacter soli TaxID=2109933 RepID=A0A2T1HLE7_9HYPH|nr:5-formyltetrahydrofolate cyclo-ligase [Alsobacter soli]PSC02476.1 5-formyltetrahydrofolate cyclo-ligase [Alsobacter soli]
MPSTPEKIAIRQLALAARARMSADDRRRAAVGAGARVLELLGALPGVVGLYVPIGDELNPRWLVETLASRGRLLALPCTPRWAAPMVFRRWAPGDPLVRGRMDVPEPRAEALMVDPDVIVVPPVAFDRRGFRIGYGGGFYDRTLPAMRARKPVAAIGIAFACQECPGVPDEPHDIPMDVVVTETEVIGRGRPMAARTAP